MSQGIPLEADAEIVDVVVAVRDSDGVVKLWKVAEGRGKIRQRRRPGCRDSWRVKEMLPDQIGDQSQPLDDANIGAGRIVNAIGQTQGWKAG